MDHVVRHVEILGADQATKDSVLCVLVGEKIGAGVFRDVYAIPGQPDVVLKVEDRGAQFCNIMEWTLWDQLQDREAGKWLAPCIHLSGLGGKALIMKRTTPITAKAWKALRIPAWMGDVKRENWGLIKGKPVCHDYGLLGSILRRGTAGKALTPTPPEWGPY